jgi:hypothetical protein
MNIALDRIPALLIMGHFGRFLAAAMSAIIRSRAPDPAGPTGGGSGGGCVVALDHAPPLLGALARVLLRAPAAAPAGLVRPRLGDGRRGCAELAPYDAIVLGAGGARARRARARRRRRGALERECFLPPFPPPPHRR